MLVCPEELGELRAVREVPDDGLVGAAPLTSAAGRNQAPRSSCVPRAWRVGNRPQRPPDAEDVQRGRPQTGRRRDARSLRQARGSEVCPSSLASCSLVEILAADDGFIATATTRPTHHERGQAPAPASAHRAWRRACRPAAPDDDGVVAASRRSIRAAPGTHFALARAAVVRARSTRGDAAPPPRRASSALVKRVGAEAPSKDRCAHAARARAAETSRSCHLQSILAMRVSEEAVAASVTLCSRRFRRWSRSSCTPRRARRCGSAKPFNRGRTAAASARSREPGADRINAPVSGQTGKDCPSHARRAIFRIRTVGLKYRRFVVRTRRCHKDSARARRR